MRAILFIFLIVIVCALQTNAQLIANAGPDKVWCWNVNSYSNPVLGADIVATGGVTPYTYRWEAYDGGNGFVKFASYFLNDTTAPNPEVIHSTYNDLVEFFLTVTDANNQVAVDNVVVRFSYFDGATFLVEKTIQPGDSIFLGNGNQGYSNFPPFQYFWHPNHGITDSTSCCFWAKPDYDIIYWLKVTDSVGCFLDLPIYSIIIEPVATNDIKMLQAKIFPNPSADRLTFKLDHQVNKPLELDIYCMKGKLRLHQTVDQQEFSADISNLPAGDYIYRITGDKLRVYSGIIVKN